MAAFYLSLYAEEEIVNLDEDELRTELENLPCCATNEDGTEHGDPLNLVLIGSREEISAAFVRRGWLPAEQTYGAAIWKTIKSFLFGSRYRYSPVSPLYFSKRQQDLAGQKPRHTVHERNHLRLWLSPMRFQGKPVWIDQISRDIGLRAVLMFDRRPHSFKEIQEFDWEKSSVSTRLQRLETDREPDFDEN